MNILVVDDNPRNIQIVGNILKEQQYQIAFALEGAKAVELAAQQDFDLVLLDIMMPEMDGYEVCQLLRSDPKTKNLPIIFLTAKTDTNSIVRGFQLGANDYVTKPFNSAELMARVKTQLELHSKRKQLDELNKHLEEKVSERTTELEHANMRLMRLEKSKSDFLSIIGHELRTPLNALVGLTTLLQSTDLTTEQNEFLFSMKHASGRLARFSEMALLITSLQTSAQLPDLYPLRVNVLFEMAIKELHFLIQEKQLEVIILNHSDTINVDGDAELIRKCLVILMENSIHQLPVGGKIELQAIETEQSETCLQVSDDGPGFTQEIIDLFSKGDEQDLKAVRALGGLSLTAVRLIMKAHGGNIGIANKPGGGAKVCLKFPRQQ